VFNAVSKYTQPQRLSFGHGILSRVSIGQHTRELKHFSTASHPAALVACYVAPRQLPRPDFHRLADDSFQDTPATG